MQDYNLRYPIGEFKAPEQPTTQDIKEAIDVLTYFPTWIESLIENMDESQLHTPYREGGWTTHQVVHHCADSHLNCLLRVKLALSNDNPTINPYPEDIWATMPDYDLPLNNSTTLLHCLHKKLVALFSHMQPTDWVKTYVHPQYGKVFTIQEVLFLYAWHCRHHFAHINELKKRMGW